MIRLSAAAWLLMGGSVWAANMTDLLVDAQTQFQASHYDQALKLYKQARDLAGSDASVRYNIGLCHLRLGDGDKAIQHFEEVASRSNVSDEVRRDALFNVGVIRTAAARQRLEALRNPEQEEDAEAPPSAVDSPENIDALKAITEDLLRAIALFRECEQIAPSEDARHNIRAARITRRNVLGLLKKAVEAKEKEDMLKDPPAYLEVLIKQQRSAVSLARRLLLDPPEGMAEQRNARRAVLRLQRQIMERTGTFADHLAQFVETTDQDQAPAGEEKQSPREQVYHAAADQLDRSITAQRDAAAFLMDGEIEPSFDDQLRALDEMYVALRLFPQPPQKALVKARTEQMRLKQLVANIESDSDWLQDPLIGDAPLPDDASLEPAKTALHYDQSQIVTALSALRAQCEQIARAGAADDQPQQEPQQTPPQLDPELNRQLAAALAESDKLGFQCLNAINSKDLGATLSRQQEILDMIDAALDLLPKTIEQRIAELVKRQATLNKEVKAETEVKSAPYLSEADSGLDKLRKLASDARSDVLGGAPAQDAERMRAEQDGIHTETEAVNDEMRKQIPNNTSAAAPPSAPPADGQSKKVQAYIEASKHLEEGGFEMLVALEGMDKAIVQGELSPMKAEGPVQLAQAKALTELIKALQALRPPNQKQQGEEKKQQDQQQQEPQDQESENARRAVERADQEREDAERQLYQRRPRTVIKDW